MRIDLLVFGLGLAVATLAAPAWAMPVGFSGTLTIDFSNGADAIFGPIVVPVAGTAMVSGGTVAIAAGEITASGTQATVSGGAPITKVELTFVNGAGSFGPGGAPASRWCSNTPTGDHIRACVNGGGLGGVMPLIGVLRFYAGGISTLNLTEGGEGLGVGGSVSAAARLSAAPWTTGNARASTYFTTVTANGSQTGPIGPGGMLNLVTPIAIDSGNGDPLLSPQFAGVASLQIQLVPEPGTSSLLGLCAAAIVVVAARPARRRRDSRN